MPQTLPQQTQPSDTLRNLDPNVEQRKATNPLDSIWVSASAGTGKTKVLSDRVLRLLLPRKENLSGTPAHKILCLTFTKAGASEMSLRINKKLSEWAVLPLDDPDGKNDLNTDLKKLLGRKAELYEISAARKLFSEVIDAPGGLQILTIHSFCQSILGRFPIEAGLSPNFTILEENQAALLLGQAQRNVLKKAKEQTTSPLKLALERIAKDINEDQFLQIIQELCKERRQLQNIIKTHWDIDGLYTAICKSMAITPGIEPENIVASACENSAFDEQALRAACTSLATGKQTDQSRGLRLQIWLDAPIKQRVQTYNDYRQIFLTDKNEPRKTLATKDVQKIAPDCVEILLNEAQRLMEVDNQIKSATCARATRDLFVLGEEIINEYQNTKAQTGTLDFDDLILRTLMLLEGTTTGMSANKIASWMMFKLDQGLDHILVDEAQDTNPEQWKIISALCDEFFSGLGAREETDRTVFIVGDEKQSIYSFQRAAPEEFTRMQHYFTEKIKECNKELGNVELITSFRTTKSVLSCVDAVFASTEMRKGLGNAPIKHEAYRRGQAGVVELWPLQETQKSDTRDPWEPPIKIIESHSGQAMLANQIANQIANWIENKELLPSHDRPIQPGDIMILVRTRTAFFNQIVRALKIKKIPVSGVDRMILNDQLPVQDLLSASTFALLPEDDLTLACLLKSPFISWDEQQLYDLAATREDQSLWAHLQASKHKADIEYLRNIIYHANHSRPFEFFSYLLQTPCPADERSGLRALKKRLGEDALDPIEELLNASLNFEKENIPSLQGFVHWQEQGSAAIKRELEEASGQVRIMTVHGSKGLQAPIVIMPDTTQTSRSSTGKADKRVLWPQKSKLDIPLWSPGKAADCALFKTGLQTIKENAEEEYRRLLYVAMTRAEDRLYICGYKGKVQPAETCWYYKIKEGLKSLEALKTLDNEVMRIDNPQGENVKPDRKAQKEIQKQDAPELPAWLLIPAKQEQQTLAPLQPSRPEEMQPPAASPLDKAQERRFRRGNITHTLLQFLPDIPLENRQSQAENFLNMHAADLPRAMRADIIKETLLILNDPAFSAIFAPGSMAEVPITGILPDGRLINGQIDRLAIKGNDIWIIDYKTNRPPPSDEQNIPQIYKNQMRSYHDILKQIYPDHRIHCALLWTDNPKLMPITKF